MSVVVAELGLVTVEIPVKVHPTKLYPDCAVATMLYVPDFLYIVPVWLSIVRDPPALGFATGINS